MGRKIFGLVVIALIVILVTVGFQNVITGAFFKNNPVSNTEANTQETNNLNEVNIVNGENFKGSPEAEITITEWSDFQCPFCARFWRDTLPLIEKEYIESGKVKFVYKHFALSFHSEAEPAALATECAGEQGKFWEMHDKIYELGTNGESSYKKWASELGLNKEQFNSCFDSNKYLDKIKSDMQEGQDKGITGTPGFLINGQIVKGAQPFSVFKTVIDNMLGN